MPNKSRKKSKKLPQIKKDIKDFLLNEEGKITKKNIAKLGISLSVLGMMLDPQSAEAQGTHASHSSHGNTMFSTNQGGHDSSTPHTNAHSNHGNHGVGGPCSW